MKRRKDLHALSGAYAVNAVDGSERDLFERHLSRCHPCDDEVRGLAETATALAFAAAQAPPAALRSRVLAAAAVTRQEPPLTEPASRAWQEPARRTGQQPARRAQPAGRHQPARRSKPATVRRTGGSWFPRLATGFAAACLAVAVVFGVLATSAQHRLNNAQAQSQAVAAVLTAPDARIDSQSTTAGGTATVVVSRTQGKFVFTASGLPALQTSRVYQLWLLGPQRTRSAGLLPAPSAGHTSPVLATGLQAGDKIGMTVEPAGGTRSPTTKPILVMTVPA